MGASYLSRPCRSERESDANIFQRLICINEATPHACSVSRWSASGAVRLSAVCLLGSHKYKRCRAGIFCRMSDMNGPKETMKKYSQRKSCGGVHESSLASSTRSTLAEQSRIGQLDLSDQLIAEQHAQIRKRSGRRKELEDQDRRLDRALQTRALQLATTETRYRTASAERRVCRRRHQDGEERLVEIQVPFERLSLLQRHCDSKVMALVPCAPANCSACSGGRMVPS